MNHDNTLWLNRDADGVAQDEHGNYVLILPNVPDYVRLPSELGGAVANVTHITHDNCPRCNSTCQHVHLDTDDLFVAVCYEHENPYAWCRSRNK